MSSADFSQQTGATPIGAPRSWDIYASVMSVLCLLHCVATPTLATFLPVAGLLTEQHWVHQLLFLLTAPVTLWVIWTSKKHPSFTSFAPAALFGLALLLVAAFVEAAHTIEEPLTIVGALVLAAAHILRWLRHRQPQVSPS